MMKTASAGLIALLAAGGPFLMADLYTLTLVGGTTYHWCTGDANVTYGGNTFTAATDQGGQPVIQRGPIRQARGLEVSTLDVTLYTGDSAQILGIDANLAACNGALDGARLKIERAFMPTWGDTSNGTVVLFEGAVAGLDVGSTQVVVHVKSDLNQLQIQMPRTLFTPSCANAFGDAGCGISLATYTVAKTVSGGSTASSLTGASGQPDGYYQNGVVAFTSGACNGSRCAVSAYVGGVLTLATPLPAVPSPGDSFTVYPNCGRTQAGCAAFGNSTRFRGCPYVPAPETTR